MSKLKIWDKELGISDYGGKAVVSSRTLAKIFDKRHDNVLRDISSAIEIMREISPLNFEGANFLEISSKDLQGKPRPEYLLTKDGFSYIAMGFTGNKAVKFKIDYINRFNEMEQYIKALNTARIEFPELMQAIADVHENPTYYHFTNEIDMINKIVIGMTAKQFKQANSLEDVPSIRPYLTAEQLHLIGMLQKIDMGLVLTEPDIQRRKRTLEWYCAKIKQKLLTA